jgi:hypothetical protein
MLYAEDQPFTARGRNSNVWTDDWFKTKPHIGREAAPSALWKRCDSR